MESDELLPSDAQSLSRTFRAAEGRLTPLDGNEPSAPLQGLRGVTLSPVTEGEIAEVLAHTEITTGDDGDLITGPERAWVVERSALAVEHTTQAFTMEVPEDEFWRLVTLFAGKDFADELRLDLDDMLRWESEGGPCLS